MFQSSNLSSQIQNSELEQYPFKHVIIRDFLPKTFVNSLLNELHLLEDSEPPTKKYSSEHGEKREWKLFPEKFSHLRFWMNYLQSTELISTLAQKFDLPKDAPLSPDHTYDGGGYVISPPGAFLGYHADFNFSSAVNKYRVLNVLYYVNTNYESNMGGHLHLLDSDSKTVESIVEPRLNTFLAFLTDDISFHGVSKNSQTFSRRSFNIYYYSEKPLSLYQSLDPHKTLWVTTDHNH